MRDKQEPSPSISDPAARTHYRKLLQALSEEIAKPGNCLPGRKRHYFGQNTGWGGGMGTPPRRTCTWCGKVNPRWGKMSHITNNRGQE